MPFDPNKLPSGPGDGVDYSHLGVAGSLVSPSDDTDLSFYARIRVFVPYAVSSATITIIPARNADNAPITLGLPSGQVSVLEYVVRRVMLTGTTAGITIHTID